MNRTTAAAGDARPPSRAARAPGRNAPGPGRRIRAACRVALLALVTAPATLHGQSDSTVVVAGERYRAGPLREWLLGRDYRGVWTTPVRVPVLDLGGYAGGLVPVRRGGGEQTRSLRLRDPRGREYNFRSVDKNIPQGLEPELRGTLVEEVLQDQVSSMHPAAALVAGGLLDAVGVLHPGPRLVVMPDDPRLGEFRQEFAGMLGFLEAHADEAEDGSWSFAGSQEVESEEDFFDRLREGPEHRVDARAYLAERLVSLLMGDWDRHAGQYRWARFDSAGISRWVPVPEDRDFAFGDYDGVGPRLAASLVSGIAPFEARYPSDLWGLLENASEMDERLLSGLSWPEWAQLVDRVTGRLSDEAIRSAVLRMPPEYVEVSGAELARLLAARRDGLPAVARRFYESLAAQAEIRATDAAERATVERLPGGGVRVTVAAGSGRGEPYFDRTFLPGETREIRLYLLGGDDRAEVRGEAAEGPLVRVIGGEGNDTLRAPGGGPARAVRTALYDSVGDDRMEAGPAAVVDRSPFREPVWIPGEVRPPRDRGSTTSWLVPWVGYEGTEGVIVGAGPVWTWYGFRRTPHAGRVGLRALYALGSGGFGVEGAADFPGVGAAPDVGVRARVSGLEAFRFHGLGNDSPGEDAVAEPIVRYAQRRLELRLGYRPRPGVSLAAGPLLERLDPEVPAGAPAASPGGEGYGKVGLTGGLSLESAPQRGVLDGGFRLEGAASAFPAAWDLAEPFARVSGEAVGYAALPARSLLAGRAGAAQLWGDAPLLEALSLGGSETLRGYRYQRFTGDALLYGGLELRSHLTDARLVLNGRLGLLAFADAGRVFVEGASDGGWHTGYGGGLWFASLGRAASLSVARGESTVVYLRLGMPF